jgi:hypothetical protein
MSEYFRGGERVALYIMLIVASAMLIGIGVPVFFGILQAVA